MLSAPVFAISRHRFYTDGDGVTTLVAFHGCPLHCRYCINAQCLDSDTPVINVSVQGLIDELMVDNLYFVATGGGVAFGGGEPLLRSDFVCAFSEQRPKEWSISLETSLNVPLLYLQKVIPYISHFYIDVKDMNENIYTQYTSKDNKRVIENLEWLISQEGMQDRVVIRLPEIPEYNTETDIESSREKLESMGFTHFDCFKYVIRL